MWNALSWLGSKLHKNVCYNWTCYKICCTNLNFIVFSQLSEIAHISILKKCTANWCRYCQLHDERLPKAVRIMVSQGAAPLRQRSQLSGCLQNWIRDECTCIFHSTAAIWMPVLTLTLTLTLAVSLSPSHSLSHSIYPTLFGLRVLKGELSCVPLCCIQTIVI